MGRHLGKPSHPALCSKRGQLEHVSQGYGQLVFERLQGWRLHSLSVWPIPVFDHHHSKRCLCLNEDSYVSMKFHVFQLVLIASCPHWALLRRVWLYLLFLSPHTLIRCPEASPGWIVPVPSASPHMPGAPVIFVALITSPLTRFQIKLCCTVPTTVLQYPSEVNYVWIWLIQNIRRWPDPVQLDRPICLDSFPTALQTVPHSVKLAPQVKWTQCIRASHTPKGKHSWTQYQHNCKEKVYRPFSEMVLKYLCCFPRHNATFQQQNPAELS